MITLSRLNGHVVAINPDLITWIDVTPDTTVSLLGGDKILVRESLDEVIERIIAFRQAITVPRPAEEVLMGIRSSRGSGRTTERPSRPAVVDLETPRR